MKLKDQKTIALFPTGNSHFTHDNADTNDKEKQMSYFIVMFIIIC